MADVAPHDRHSPLQATRLMRQFLALAGVVLVAGMLGMGMWIGAQIERVVTANAGATTALYVDSMISPVTQEMSATTDLGAEQIARLRRILEQGALSREISAFKLWDGQGRIVFSTRPGQIGQVVTDNPRLAVALTGEVHAALRNVTLNGDAGNQTLMEVYSPIRSVRTGEVIAVAEFYTTTTALRTDLLNSRIKSWFVVGMVTLAMFLAFYTIVARGDRTIRQQRRALDQKIAELSASLRDNESLTRRVGQANRRIAEINERSLRRVSADIHDGPAQLLAFAALRLDGAHGYEQVSEAVNEALQDLRFICRGLVLPELQAWTVADIARRLLATHEARMGGHVVLKIDAELPDMPLAAKNCIYRFLQETLNNSARHAAGAGQSVVIRRRGEGIEVEVSDTGPGFDPDRTNGGLGLAGLRERIAGLRGRFDLHTRKGQGTSLTMWLPLTGGGYHE